MACGGSNTPSEPDPTNGNNVTLIEVVSGTPPSDTAGARAMEPIVARVVNGSGAALPSRQVTVRVPIGAPVPGVWLRASADGSDQGELSLTSDALGEFQFWVTLRTVSGRATIELRPSGAFATTEQVYVDILPATAVTVELIGSRGLLAVGDSTRVTGAGLDQFGNHVGPVEVLEVEGPGVANGPWVTGTDVGDVSVIGSVGMASDTVEILMVPDGRILFPDQDGEIWTMRMDGTESTSFGYGVGVADPTDHPVGPGAAFGARGAIFLTTDYSGFAPVTGSNLYDAATLPRFSHDGALIYFTAEFCAQGAEIWRISPDGGATHEAVTDVPTIGDADRHPSPSSLGGRLAFSRTTNGSLVGPLMVKDLGTRVESPLGVDGQSSRWSPDDEWIAYLDGDAMIRRIKPDGTEDQAVLPGEQFHKNFAWSPDGRFIIATTALADMIRLIEVATGEAWTIPHSQPAQGIDWER